MRKLTREEFIAKALSRARRPIDLSQFEYSGSAAKSIAICPQHGPFQISANALMNRIGCVKCFESTRGQSKKITQEGFLDKVKTVHGDKYDYSKSKYQDAKTKIVITCKVHGDFKQQANSHLSGCGCPKCKNTATGDRSRMSAEKFISRCVEMHGDKYNLSKVLYSGMAKKIEVICPSHGSFFPTAGNFVGLGSGCPDCGRKAAGLKSRESLEHYVKKARVKHGDKFSYNGVTYRGSSAYLSITCPEHGEFEQLAQDHIKGIGCAKCSFPMWDQATFVSLANIVHSGKYSYNNARYSKAQENTEITCPIHGPFWQTPNSHVNDSAGCPRCASVGPSTGQLEIAEFLGKTTEVILEKRLSESNKRLDMFLPEHSLAVEYHGLVWHSTKFSTEPRKDFIKHQLASSEGIRTIHIYEDEWKFKRDVVERTLLSAIRHLPKIGARKTEAKEVGVEEANAFFNKNHLQGEPNSSVFLGLYLSGELVSCMSFGVARSVRRNTDPQLWELQRYASSCTVVGGASKLLSMFVRMGLCHTIISYSDTRLFSGGMYEKLGFSLEHETKPDYCYVSTSVSDGRLHKSKFQRKHLAKKLKTFDPSKSESQNCFDNGWYQLFDCGKKKWVLSIQ